MNVYDDDELSMELAEGERLRAEARAILADSAERRATSTPKRIASTAKMSLFDAQAYLTKELAEALPKLLPMYGHEGDTPAERLADMELTLASNREIVDRDFEAVAPGLKAEADALELRKLRIDHDSRLDIQAKLADTLSRIPAKSDFLANRSGSDIFSRALDASRFDGYPSTSALTRTVREIIGAGEAEKERRGEKMNPYADALIESVGIDRALELAAEPLPDDGRPSTEQAELDSKTLDELAAMLDDGEPPEHPSSKWVGTHEKKAQPSDGEIKSTIAALEHEIDALDGRTR